MVSKLPSTEDVQLGLPELGWASALTLTTGSMTWLYSTGNSAQGGTVAFPEQVKTKIEIGTSTGIYIAPTKIKIESAQQTINSFKMTSALSLLIGATLLVFGLQTGVWMLTIGGIGLIGTVIAALREAFR